MSVSVCLSVCPQAYHRNYTSDLDQFLGMLPMAVARSSSIVALRYAMYFRFYGGMSMASQQVTLLRSRAQANASAASYCGVLCVFIDDHSNKFPL